MIIKDKNYELNSFCNIKNEKQNEILEVKLKQIKIITNISYMFNGCSLLTKLADISKWSTNKITDISFMFTGCSELLSLPEISK